MRRLGIMKNEDGTFTVSPCRAKIGNEGKFGCHHFAHKDNAAAATKFIEFLETHKNDMQGLNMTEDTFSIDETVKDYLVDKKNVSAEDIDAAGGLNEWKSAHEDDYKQALNEMTSESDLKHMMASPELQSSVKALADDGVTMTVCADRVVGMKDSYADDTKVWMDMNGVDYKLPADDEASVTLLVNDANGEDSTARSFRRNYVAPKREMSDDEKKAFRDIKYVSMK